MLKLILVVAAVIAFLFDAFHVKLGKVEIGWTPLGFALVTCAVLLPLPL